MQWQPKVVAIFLIIWVVPLSVCSWAVETCGSRIATAGYHFENGILVPNQGPPENDLVGEPLHVETSEFTINIQKEGEWYQVLHLEIFYYRRTATMVSSIQLRPGTPPEVFLDMDKGYGLNSPPNNAFTERFARSYSHQVAAYGAWKYKKLRDQWVTASAERISGTLNQEFADAMINIADKHAWQSRYVIEYELTPSLELGQVVATGRDILNPYRWIRFNGEPSTARIDNRGKAISRLMGLYDDPNIGDNPTWAGYHRWGHLNPPNSMNRPPWDMGLWSTPVESFFGISLFRGMNWKHAVWKGTVPALWGGTEEVEYPYEVGLSLHHDFGMISARKGWERIGLAHVGLQLARLAVQPEFTHQSAFIAITTKTKRLHHKIICTEPVEYIDRPLSEMYASGIYDLEGTPLSDLFSTAPIPKMGIDWTIEEVHIPTILQRAYSIRNEKPFYTVEQEKALRSFLRHLSARDLVMGGVPPERVMEALNKFVPE